MKIFNIEPFDDPVSDDDSIDVKIIDLDDCCGDGCDVRVFIPGPAGPTGPTGPQGPAGPAGSSGGTLVTVTVGTTIPVNQIFTRVNASGNTTQILPLSSAVFVAGVTNVYTIKNVSSHQVTVAGQGGDTVEDGANVLMRFLNESLSFIAVTGGWEII